MFATLHDLIWITEHYIMIVHVLKSTYVEFTNQFYIETSRHVEMMHARQPIKFATLPQCDQVSLIQRRTVPPAYDVRARHTRSQTARPDVNAVHQRVCTRGAMVP